MAGVWVGVVDGGLGSVRLGWLVVPESMVDECWEAESARQPESAAKVAANMKRRQIFRICCKGSKDSSCGLDATAGRRIAYCVVRCILQREGELCR